MKSIGREVNFSGASSTADTLHTHSALCSRVQRTARILPPSPAGTAHCRDEQGKEQAEKRGALAAGHCG